MKLHTVGVTAYESSEYNQMEQKEVILRQKKSSKKEVKGVGNLRIRM